jgi:hypothetical protein
MQDEDELMIWNNGMDGMDGIKWEAGEGGLRYPTLTLIENLD